MASRKPPNPSRTRKPAKGAPRADAKKARPKPATPAPRAAPPKPRGRPAPTEKPAQAAFVADQVTLEGPHRSGFVALVGRPNVGKSTLLNALLGEKLAAASPRPQTTRRQFRGILTLKGAQLVLVDTPGLFEGAVLPDSGKGGYGELGAFMAREVRSALSDVDAVIWVEEATPTTVTAQEPNAVQKAIGELIRGSNKPVLLALNKVDTVAKSALLPLMAAWKDVLPFAAVVPISAARADGLPGLVKEAAQLLPESPALFEESDLTDATERDIVAEFIREKVMMRTGEEVPYAVAVEVERFDESRREQPGPRGGVVEIDATIHVEREGQKAIVVGASGAKIKEIGVLARQDMERFLGCRVMLRLFVKVSEHWTRSKTGLRSLGYVSRRE